MSRADEVKAQRRALLFRKAELREKLEQVSDGDRRKIRIELAGVEEDLILLTRRLRELEPRHKVSCRTTWGGVDGRAFDYLQYQTWAQMEGTEEPDGPAERDLMVQALRVARDAMTPIQRSYMEAVERGKRAADVARDVDRHRSTLSRCLSSGRAIVTKEAKKIYAVRSLQERDGGLDLAQPDHLAAFLDLLTERQQLYLTLYYGEWMSLREIGSLLEVDHATVLRTMRRALERLHRCLGPGAKVDGIEAIEKLLMEHFSTLRPEDWQHGRTRGKYGVRIRQSSTVDIHEEESLPQDVVNIRPGVGGGELRAWLEERKAEAKAAGVRVAAAVCRLLFLLLRLTRAHLPGRD